MYADKNFYLSGTPATTLTGSGTPQAITATAASTNLYDFGTNSGSNGQADGEDALWVDIILPAALTGTVSVFTIALQDCDTEGGTYRDLVVSRVFANADLVGAAALTGNIMRFAVPPACRRFLRVNYTLTTGTISAGGFFAVLKAYN